MLSTRAVEIINKYLGSKSETCIDGSRTGAKDERELRALLPSRAGSANGFGWEVRSQDTLFNIYVWRT